MRLPDQRQFDGVDPAVITLVGFECEVVIESFLREHQVYFDCADVFRVTVKLVRQTSGIKSPFVTGLLSRLETGRATAPAAHYADVMLCRCAACTRHEQQGTAENKPVSFQDCSHRHQ